MVQQGVTGRRTRRLSVGDESGFTLVELMVIVAILGILLSIAVASFVGFRSRAENVTAEANLRAALPAAEAFYADNKTYLGLDDPTTGMKAYDQGIAATVTVNDPGDLSDTHYCLRSVKGAAIFWLRGPGGQITSTKPAGCT